MPRFLPVPPVAGGLCARQSRTLALLAAAILAAALAMARAAPVRSAEPGDTDAAAPVAGVASLTALASWLDEREGGANTRLGEAEQAAAARLGEERQAAARLAEVEERSTAILANRQALEEDVAGAAAARAAAEDAVRRLDVRVAGGLLAVATYTRNEASRARDAAHLRAVVGSLAGLYAADRERARELREEADRLAARGWELDAQRARLEVEQESRRAELGAATAALLASLRDADDARRRRDALVAYAADLRERERIAGSGDGLIRDAASDISPQPARALPSIGARLAAEQPARDLAVEASAILPPPTAPGATVAAFGTATAPLDALDTPLVDPIVARPVEPRGEDRFRFGRGVLLESAVAQTVSAPCAGRVVFAEPFKDFGLLLIIDRGDGYHALLSGMSRLGVGRGATVVAGQAVGAIELVDGVARLYFELRRHGSPVDPSAWSSLLEDRVRS